MNKGVVRFLHKLCSVSFCVNMVLINPSKRYIAPSTSRIEKSRGKKEIFLFQIQNKRGNKKMFSGIESVMILPTQIFHIVRVPMGQSSAFSTK